MLRDYRAYLDDVLEAIGNIEAFTAGLDYDGFVRDTKTVHAVIRDLEVVGEAVKKLPDDVRARRPDIEWKRIAGLRDVLIHDYFGIDHEIIWDVVQNKLPPLRSAIQDLLDSTAT